MNWLEERRKNYEQMLANVSKDDEKSSAYKIDNTEKLLGRTKVELGTTEAKEYFHEKSLIHKRHDLLKSYEKIKDDYNEEIDSNVNNYYYQQGQRCCSSSCKSNSCYCQPVDPYSVDEDDLPLNEDEADIDVDDDIDDGAAPAKKPSKHLINDEAIKQRAISTPIYMMAFCDCKNNECQASRDVDKIVAIRNSLWGKWQEPAPSRSTRRNLYWEILKVAAVNEKGELRFPITNLARNNIYVCEAAYLIMTGISNDSRVSEAPKQWRDLKSCKVKGTDPNEKKEVDKDSSNRPTFIKDDALNWIINYAKTSGDTMPTLQGR